MPQTNAIERLSHFFEDAMSKSNNKLDSDEVKKVLDAAIEPMAKTYATATLDEKTRKVLIRSLGDMRDPRANVAYIKALGGYEAGKEDDAKAAAGAVKSWAVAGKPIDQGVKDALWECFSKLQPSKSPNKGPIDEVHAAVLAVKDPSYGPKAIKKLGVKVTDHRGQLWQAEALRSREQAARAQSPARYRAQIQQCCPEMRRKPPAPPFQQPFRRPAAQPPRAPPELPSGR